MNIQELREAEPNSMLAVGTGYYPEIFDYPIAWVAVKGDTTDWSIYWKPLVHQELSPTFLDCAKSGDKIHNKRTIQRMVDPDNETMEVYRR